MGFEISGACFLSRGFIHHFLLQPFGVPALAGGLRSDSSPVACALQAREKEWFSFRRRYPRLAEVCSCTHLHTHTHTQSAVISQLSAHHFRRRRETDLGKRQGSSLQTFSVSTKPDKQTAVHMRPRGHKTPQQRDKKRIFQASRETRQILTKDHEVDGQ